MYNIMHSLLPSVTTWRYCAVMMQSNMYKSTYMSISVGYNHQDFNSTWFLLGAMDNLRTELHKVGM